MPKDLYNPIVTDSFPLHKAGFEKIYILNCKYIDIYDIGFFLKDKNISSKYKFQGKIIVEFFYRDKLLFKKSADSIKSAWYVEGDMSKYDRFSLIDFEMPLLGKHKNDISVRVSVLDPDQALKKYGDSIMLPGFKL